MAGTGGQLTHPRTRHRLQDQRPCVARRVETGRAVAEVMMWQLEDEGVEGSEKAEILFKIESRPHATAVEREACTCGLPRPGDVLGGDDDFEHMWVGGE